MEDSRREDSVRTVGNSSEDTCEGVGSKSGTVRTSINSALMEEEGVGSVIVVFLLDKFGMVKCWIYSFLL
jgi:hypothetical protein